MTHNYKNGDFALRLSLLKHSEIGASLRGIKHGVEREALRVTESGGLATSPHSPTFGSALTHEWITTDFSESLMEFITPPETDISKTIGQLSDIHKFVHESLKGESLWPLSMPCFIDANTRIPIARYGSSNIAKMKETYRHGLHNRYGSMMQVISGVHLNFSLPDTFWQHWCAALGLEVNKNTISEQYFALLRNFRRVSWLIPYLFGASPALCGSFIAHRKTKHDFKKLGKGTLYLPYATSLRMSDLGYTSSAQADLKICTDSLDNYVGSVRKAINMPAAQYEKIKAGQGGEWEQLNTNVLQIENELYAPIRPKQVAQYLEKPTDALERRGVSYLEVRGLDVNPFSQIGIDEQQIRFIDALLVYCLVAPSPYFSDEDHVLSKQNLNTVVLQGRDPLAMLYTSQGEKSLKSVASELMQDIKSVAGILDEVNNTSLYTQALLSEVEKVDKPELTFSGRLLGIMQDNDVDNSALGLELAKEYAASFSEIDYTYIEKQAFMSQSAVSKQKQMLIESQDDCDFTTFVRDYFAESTVKA
ncbi:glutamate--cysteine ligase [Agaribacter flavus]|uniref:Glutamate--cysteine ligase n=1 Tax=Agaribacter flavus TaxID=1902781 RepID=A0ABV7FMG4_9ALTE